MNIYVILGILSILAGGAYFVYDITSELEKTKADNVTLTTAVESQLTTINSLQEDFTLANKANANLRKTANQQELEISNLNEKFKIQANGQSRDLGAITRDKPTLINKIINNATDNVNRCFELATGAPKLKGEKNNECKEFINSIPD